MQKLIQHAKEKKLTIKLCHAKIMFCGSSKAGKTSFTKLLQNIEFVEEDYTSTDVGETTQVLVSDMVNVRGTEWILLNTELEIKQLTQQLLSKRNNVDFELDLELMASGSNDTYTLDVTSTVPNDRSERNHTTVDSRNIVNQQQQTFNDDTVQQNTLVGVEKIMASSTCTSELPRENLEIWNILTLFDTGGQPEFINLLPAINAAAAINFIVLDISNGVEYLDQPVVAQHSNKSYNKRELNYTNLHLIECLLSLITESALKNTFFPEAVQIKGDQHPNPVVNFVGAFFDQLAEKNTSQESQHNVVNKLNVRLNKLIDSVNLNRILDVWAYDKSILITVDNTIAGKPQNERSVAKRIRSDITELLKEKGHYEIPITWFILQLQLRHEEKVCLHLDHVKILSDQIMPSDQKMNLWQIKVVLKFYHLLGVLLYFDGVEGMKDFVITDPQWLFGNLAKLITCTFKKDKHCKAEPLNKFIKEGIFSKKLLDSIDLDIYDVKQESFLSLLEYLKIVAPMDGMGQEYFMPSILPTFKWNSDDEDIPNGDEYGSQMFYKLTGDSYPVKPLLITFNFGTIPRGLFCFLVVQLLQKNTSWKLYGINECTIIYRYDNLITIRISTFCYLSIIDRVRYLELQLRIQDKVSPLHYEAQIAVTDALKTICVKFGWKFTDLHYGFLCCKCSSRPNHLTILSNIEPIPEVIPQYAECGWQPTLLTEGHKVWFFPLEVQKYFFVYPKV